MNGTHYLLWQKQVGANCTCYSRFHILRAFMVRLHCLYLTYVGLITLSIVLMVSLFRLTPHLQ